MTKLFEPVELTWKGDVYAIPPSRVLRAIAVVEDVITLQQLSMGPRVPLAKLAMAYAALLRFAGGKVTDDEMYLALFGPKGADATAQVQMMLRLMLPKTVWADVEQQAKILEGAEARGEAERGNVGPDGSGAS